MASSRNSTPVILGIRWSTRNSATGSPRSFSLPRVSSADSPESARKTRYSRAYRRLRSRSTARKHLRVVVHRQYHRLHHMIRPSNAIVKWLFRPSNRARMPLRALWENSNTPDNLAVWAGQYPMILGVSRRALAATPREPLLRLADLLVGQGVAGVAPAEVHVGAGFGEDVGEVLRVVRGIMRSIRPAARKTGIPERSGVTSGSNGTIALNRTAARKRPGWSKHEAGRHVGPVGVADGDEPASGRSRTLRRRPRRTRPARGCGRGGLRGRRRPRRAGGRSAGRRTRRPCRGGRGWRRPGASSWPSGIRSSSFPPVPCRSRSVGPDSSSPGRKRWTKPRSGAHALSPAGTLQGGEYLFEPARGGSRARAGA